MHVQYITRMLSSRMTAWLGGKFRTLLTCLHEEMIKFNVYQVRYVEGTSVNWGHVCMHQSSICRHQAHLQWIPVEQLEDGVRSEGGGGGDESDCGGDGGGGGV